MADRIKLEVGGLYVSKPGYSVHATGNPDNFLIHPAKKNAQVIFYSLTATQSNVSKTLYFPYDFGFTPVVYGQIESNANGFVYIPYQNPSLSGSVQLTCYSNRVVILPNFTGKLHVIALLEPLL